jgi:hypothetical protein
MLKHLLTIICFHSFINYFYCFISSACKVSGKSVFEIIIYSKRVDNLHLEFKKRITYEYVYWTDYLGCCGCRKDAGDVWTAPHQE